MVEISSGEPARLTRKILYGHTHLPREARLNNDCLIVNPGSIGLQTYADDMLHPHITENGTPHARYAIPEKTDKSWSKEFISVLV